MKTKLSGAKSALGGKKKYFDAVQMVRDIRDAMFKQATDRNFDIKEFDRIKEKWTKLLEQQEKSTVHNTGLAK
ncbi:MAG TPA: hypothetical protein VI757_10885 [Bacteroidia bacterium]|nr:hypothetical protein [Bacteroidia bacterium]